MKYLCIKCKINTVDIIMGACNACRATYSPKELHDLHDKVYRVNVGKDVPDIPYLEINRYKIKKVRS